MNPKERIKELVRILNGYSKAYYNDNNPLVSDAEYDALYAELRTLEERFPSFVFPDSPTTRVGYAPVAEKSKEVAHEYPMLSLDNSYSHAEVAEFFKRLEKFIGTGFDITVEPKIDGAAVSLTWDNGELQLAATRGDGKTGEDITTNAGFIVNLPKRLSYNKKLVVRGEVYMSKDIFHELNRQRAEDELPLFANPRNAAAGSLKLLDSDEAKNRKLQMFVYGADRFEDSRGNHFDDLMFCKSEKLPVNDIIFRCKSLEDVSVALAEIEKKRFTLPYEIDGAVIKVDSYTLRDEAGFTAKFPRWALAFKYPAVQMTTKLLDVAFQVGRTGALTPVANLEPVLLSGSTVSRASLHNEDEITRLDLMIGDSVFIEKGGEIIPKIVKRTGGHPPDARPIIFPEKCPVCGHSLNIDADDAKRRCINRTCPAIVKGAIEHFVSRNAMDIKGLGDKAIEELYNAGILGSYADIYSLKIEHLKEREGWGQLSAENLINAIEGSKSRPFDKVLFALGIRHVGSGAAKLLVEKFINFDSLKNASVQEIESVKGIGSETALSLVKAMADAEFAEICSRLMLNGLQFASGAVKISGKLSDKTFLITGTLDKPRKFYEDMIIANGGNIASSVSKKLNYLIVGEDAGNKLEKAKSYGVTILALNDFLKML